MTLCYSDIETREAIRRLKEVTDSFGFCSVGGNSVDIDITAEVEVLQRFLAYLRTREHKRLPWFRKSPQLRYRSHLIDYVMRLCTNEQLTSETTYLAIYMVDRFMDRHDIAVNQLGHIGTVCVSLSGKLLETSNRTPRFRRMVRYLKEVAASATIKHLVGLEEYVLEAFDFDILVPTEVNFLEIYLLYVVDGMHAAYEDANDSNNNNNFMVENANYSTFQSTDYQRKENNVVSPKKLVPFKSVAGITTLVAMTELAFSILEAITKKGEPNNIYKPSRVAAAILLASRREHGLNTWTVTLQKVTSYSIDQVYNCLKNYVEPKLTGLNLTQPFDPPEFVNVAFRPFLIVPEADTDQSF